MVVIVQPAKDQFDNPGYRVAVCSKSKVLPFGPKISQNYVYMPDQNFRMFLLTKRKNEK